MKTRKQYQRAYRIAEKKFSVILPVLNDELEKILTGRHEEVADQKLEENKLSSEKKLSLAEEIIRQKTYMFWWDVWARHYRQ